MGREPIIYLILTEMVGRNRAPLSIARDAIAGGISCLQMREKNKRRKELLPLGHALRRLCAEHGTTFIVNDDPLLAKRIDANGAHLGQEDLLRHPLKETRRLLGRKKIIGLSTHSLEQAWAAARMDVDYIAFGPLYPTPAKPYHIGTDEVAEVLHFSPKPVVLIGGINTGNIGELTALGGRYFAMIRGILDTDDIMGRVRAIRSLLQLPE